MFYEIVLRWMISGGKQSAESISKRQLKNVLIYFLMFLTEPEVTEYRVNFECCPVESFILVTFSDHDITNDTVFSSQNVSFVFQSYDCDVKK